MADETTLAEPAALSSAVPGRSGLPYPIAALVRRTRNAKSAKERHDTAFHGWEASVRLAVSACPPSDPTTLAIPSAGSWAAALRPSLSDVKLADPGVLRAYRLFSEFGLDQRLNPASVTARAILDALVAYRNQILGHASTRASEFYDAAGDALLAGLEAAWAGDLFWEHGAELVYAESVELDSTGQKRARIFTLNAEGPVLENRQGTAAVPENLLPKRLYLREGRRYTPLHPWIVYRESEQRERVMFYNGKARYLDYVSGEILGGRTLQEAFPGLREEAEEFFNSKSRETPAVETAGDPNDFGDYEIIGELGHGGMARVCLARQKSLDRRVAIKIPILQGATDAAVLLRFKREVRALSRCDHPNVVKILDSGEHNGTPFYVMEYVEGADLQRVAKALSTHGSFDRAVSSASHEIRMERARKFNEAPPPAPPSKSQTRSLPGHPALNTYRRIAMLFRDAALGLHHLHENGIIHRDVKPGNLMLTTGDHRIVVMDLGLATLADTLKSVVRENNVTLVGTLRYMAPEQLQRNLVRLDRRVDVYSLCATFYELMSDRPFFDGENEQRLLQQVLFEEPLSLGKANALVPRDLQLIVQKGIQKDPRLRYQTAEELAADLSRWLRGEPVLARDPTLGYLIYLGVRRHWGMVLTGLAGLLLTLGVSAYFLVKHQRLQEQIAANALLAKRGAEASEARQLLESARALENDHRYTAARSAIERAQRKMKALGEPNDAAEHALTVLYLRHPPPVLTFEGHRGRIYSIALSRDGAFAYTAGVDGGTGAVKAWDLRTGQQQNQYLTLPGDRLFGLALSPDGTHAVTSGWMSHLQYWNLATGERKAFGKKPGPSMAPSMALAYSPSGRYLASGDIAQQVRLWDTQTFEEVCEPIKTRGIVRSIRFSGEDTLVVGGNEGRVRVFRFSDGGLHLLRMLPSEENPPAHAGGINQIALSEGGEVLVTVGDDRLMKVWRLSDGASLGQGYGHGSEVTQVALADDAQHAVTAAGTSLFVWNLETLHEPLKLQCGWHASTLTALAVLPGSETALTAGADGSLMLWNLPLHKTPRFTGASGSIYSVTFSPDGKLALSGGGSDLDPTVRLWDVDSGQEIRRFEAGDPVRAVQFSADGRRACALCTNTKLQVWDLNAPDGSPPLLAQFPDEAANRSAFDVPEFKSDEYRRTPFNQNAFSRDGRLAASQIGDNRVAVRETENGTLRCIPVPSAADGSSISGLALSGDDRRLLVANRVGILRLYDLTPNADGRAAATLLLEREVPGKSNLNAAALNADGTLALTGDMNFAARLWNLSSGQEKQVFEGHLNTLLSVSFAPDGWRFASGGMDQSVHVWDTRDGRELDEFRNLPGGIWGLAWSPDGRRILYGCRGTGYIGLLDYTAAERLRELEPAVAGAQRQLKSEPHNPAALGLLGEWLAIQGAWSGAAENLEAARRAAPDAFSRFELLGACHWLRARTEKDPARRAERFREARDAYASAKAHLPTGTAQSENDTLRLNLILRKLATEAGDSGR